MRNSVYVAGSALWLATLVSVAVHSQGPRLTATPPQVATPQPAANTQSVQGRYVGSQACQRCHAEKYERWTHTRMANVVTDPKVNPGVVVGDFSKPDPLVTFRLDDVALVYGTKWKQRYFIRRNNDYVPAPAQWDITNKIWRPFFVQPNTDWWVPLYPAQPGDNTGRPTGPLCDGCHSVNFNVQNKPAARRSKHLYAQAQLRTGHGPRAASAPFEESLAA
jgi:Cytochrome c554 and c-prime